MWYLNIYIYFRKIKYPECNLIRKIRYNITLTKHLLFQ